MEKINISNIAPNFEGLISTTFLPKDSVIRINGGQQKSVNRRRQSLLVDVQLIADNFDTEKLSLYLLSIQNNDAISIVTADVNSYNTGNNAFINKNCFKPDNLVFDVVSGSLQQSKKKVANVSFKGKFNDIYAIYFGFSPDYIDEIKDNEGANAYCLQAPINPENGSSYIVGIGATGIFSGQDLKIATYNNGSWTFSNPQNPISHGGATNVQLYYEVNE